MRGLRLNRILAGTALAAILAVPAPVLAEPEADAAIAAKVPMTNFADLPPPTVADIGAAPGLSVDALVPMPRLTDDMPPPSIADIGPVPAAPKVAAPAPAATPAPAVNAASVAPATPAPATAPATPAAAAAPAPATDTTASVQPETPAPVIAAAPAVDPADQAIADKLATLIDSKQFDRIVTTKVEREAVEALYAGRNNMPLWLEKGVPSSRAKQALAVFADAGTIGLDPKDYRAQDLTGTPEAAAEAELRFTIVALTYARHAQSGRTDPSKISSNIEYKLPMPEPEDVLARLAGSDDLVKTFASFEPPHEGYQALRRKLAELRGSKDEAQTIQIPKGPSLKVGAKKPVKDARVPALRQRLGLAGDANDKTYDAELAAAVKKFQASKGLSATGTLTQSTVDALNGVRKDRQIDAVIASMERWRWLPRDLGTNYVMLNIPDFTLKVVKDGTVAWRTRVVVGKPSTPTPIFSSAIENILVNPTWHVPESIVYGEYLPALQQDPSVLQRMGLNVRHNPDGTTSITQPPGPGNALGRIKFNFSNRFQVYLHDTPDKNLFAHERRAYSHGCMRVQNPDQFGAVLASIGLPGKGYTAEKLTSMYGRGEAWLKFTTTVPVHLTYMTAFVDDAGNLVVRDDIYSHDGRVLAALKGSDRDYGEEEVMAQIKRTPRPKPAHNQRYVQDYRQSPIEQFFGRLFR